MSRIFINYRREDSAPYAGRLYDRLAAHFGDEQVFIDIDNIELGEDFAETVARTVGTRDVLLAVIGKSWVQATDSSGRRRLDLEEDWVRMEIQHALDRGIRVIPVLVGGAVMPSKHELPAALSSLSTRNALLLNDLSFRQDVAALIKAIQKALDSSASAATTAQAPTHPTVGEVIRPPDAIVSPPPGARPAPSSPDASHRGEPDAADVRVSSKQRDTSASPDFQRGSKAATETIEAPTEPTLKESVLPAARLRWMRRLTIVQLICGVLLFLGGGYGVLTAKFELGYPGLFAYVFVGIPCSIALGFISRRAGFRRGVIQGWVVTAAIVALNGAELWLGEELQYSTDRDTLNRLGMGAIFLSGAVLVVSAYLLLMKLRKLQRDSP